VAGHDLIHKFMKLLVSELEALRTYVTREFYYVMGDLIRHFNWSHMETGKLWHAYGTIGERLVREFGEMPETILFWEGYDLLIAHSRDIQNLRSRKVILADDLHWWNDTHRQKRAVAFAVCDLVLATCAYQWDEFYPEFAGSKQVAWVPHSASPDFLVPYNSHPANSIFVSGAAGAFYPLREQMWVLHGQRANGLVCQGHPGYYTGYDHEHDGDVGRGYAMKINSYRAAFTDSSIYRYVVAKYFEIPATGALLLADDSVSGPLRQLGFVEYEHYLPVAENNLEERIRFVLAERNHDQLDEMRSRAQQLVLARHQTFDRARLIDALCTN
jgi:hypothetical protein